MTNPDSGGIGDYYGDPPDDDRWSDAAWQRAEEDERELRWIRFVRVLKDYDLASVLELLATLANHLPGDDEQELAERVQTFQREEGWPGVLRALARAVQEQDVDRMCEDADRIRPDE